MEGNHDVLVAAYIQREDGEGIIHAEIFHALGGYKALWQKVSLVQPRAELEKTLLDIKLQQAGLRAERHRLLEGGYASRADF